MSDILDDPHAETQHPPSEGKPTVWRSLREFDATLAPEGDDSAVTPDVANFVGREFPTDDFDELGEVDRRRFFQILGASAALAGASSCRWEREEILAHKIRPEETIPGKPKHYASVMDLAGFAKPLKVTSYDGRPVKVEPNLLVGRGSDVYSQGEVLGFYDPDRSSGALQRVSNGFRQVSNDDVLAALQAKASEGGLAVLASTNGSPTLARLGEELARTGAKWVWWSPVDRDSVVDGTRLAFGRPVRAHYDLENADIVVSLDSDFLAEHPDAHKMGAGFGLRREPERGSMSRLYSIESRFTTCGVVSDHRLPVRSSDVGAVLELIEAELGRGTPGKRAVELKANEKLVAFVTALADDLRQANGRVVVIPGHGQPAEVHARAHGLNAALGAIGTTVRYTDEPLASARTAELAGLLADMRSGAVKTLLVLGGNPAYDAPADLKFAEAAKNVTLFHHGLYRDETAVVCDWHLPATHWLEAWGDSRSWDGTHHIAQPLIKPIANGTSAIEVLAKLVGREADGRVETRTTFDALGLAGDQEARYRQSLHDGLVDGSRMPFLDVTPTSDLPVIPEAEPGMELSFFACPKVFDGRFANNGWLQELPDFTTKMTWDNAVLIGVKTAKALGIKTGSKVRVTVDGRSLDAAAYVAPGQAEDSLALSLGYGRRHGGLVAGFDKADVDAAGFDAYQLRGTASMSIANGVQIEKTRGTYEFATTQEHHLIDAIGMKGRRERLHKLAMEGTEEQWQNDHNFTEHVYHVPKLESLFDTKEYDGRHQWGMTIDLSTCSGCNACVVACQSENNIPIVGKEQVKRGREMHWMRIDLYYQGDAEEADTMDAVSQPVSCIQCENAPCEQVCPVAATVHGEEGTNDMVYNRCIGTRYCGNNCPVKVRRFNYFHYTKYMDKPEHKRLQLAQNPNVTVRSRGVMEKCTYCIQRISEARIVARNEGRKIRDGEIVTACEAACSSGAIVFGDISDPESRVSKKRELGRAYSMLAELNIRPRTQFLARISNPNPVLAEAMPQGVRGREDYDPATYGHGGHGHGHDGHGHGHGDDSHGDGHGAGDSHGSDSHSSDSHGEKDAGHDGH
ncbi:MAG: Fe-S-cluster-containing hydrogenase [Planctomycetota bacterium]